MRKLFTAVYSVLLVFLLIIGIYYADLNTRRVGFKDAKPVFCCNINEEELYLHIFDVELRLDTDKSVMVNSIINKDKKTVPLLTKFIKALNGFIKMITDLFLQAVGQ